jgi:hypothetical protein
MFVHHYSENIVSGLMSPLVPTYAMSVGLSSPPQSVYEFHKFPTINPGLHYFFHFILVMSSLWIPPQTTSVRWAIKYEDDICLKTTFGCRFCGFSERKCRVQADFKICICLPMVAHKSIPSGGFSVVTTVKGQCRESAGRGVQWRISWCTFH